MRKYLNLRANIALGLIFAFSANTLGPLPLAQAQEFSLPAPGEMVHLSPAFNPPILKGIKVHPDNPFRFDFILDEGGQPGDTFRSRCPQAGCQASKPLNVKATQRSSTGGIDLTHANMNLQTKMAPSQAGDNEGIKFHLDPAMLQQLQNAPGFVPVIINIQPLVDLRQFLGVAQESH